MSHVSRVGARRTRAQPRTALAGLAVALVIAGCSGDSATQPSPIVTELATLHADAALPSLDPSASVAGTDADSNGVRDDIDAFIASRNATAQQTAALKQMAKAYQASLTVDTTQSAAVLAVAAAINGSVGCVWSVYGPGGASQVVRELEAFTVNTLNRIAAYDRFNTAMNGTRTTLATGVVCD